MADIWGDYLISQVHYMEAYGRQYISKALVHSYQSLEIDIGSTWLRADLIIRMDKGYYMYTIYKDENGVWRKGDKVDKVYMNGSYYIKTAASEVEEDNLGDLAELYKI